MKTPLQGKKNGVQQEKTPSSIALAAAAAASAAASAAAAATRLGARKKSLFPQVFFGHLGRDAGSIHRAWLCLTFGLPAAPRATFILARITKMAISRIGGVLLATAFYLARPHLFMSLQSNLCAFCC